MELSAVRDQDLAPPVKKKLGKRILVSTDRFDSGVEEGVVALTQSRVAKLSAEAFDQAAVHDAGDRCSRSHLPAEQRTVEKSLSYLFAMPGFAMAESSQQASSD